MPAQGNGNISPSRLRQARQCRGLSAKALADRLGISSQSVNYYESGENSPHDRISEIATLLRFPVAFFYGDDIDDVPPASVSFRSLKSTTSGVRNKLLARAGLASGILSNAFHNSFRMPSLDVPDLSTHDPEQAAMLLRSYWSLGQSPIGNMVHLLESKGVEVYWLHEETNEVDACSYWRGSRPYVILNDHKLAGERQRSDCGHELGHLVLHRDVDSFDNATIEGQAKKFSAAFLLPKDQFSLECPRSSHFMDYAKLKKRWGVSIQIMVYRSYELGLITRYQFNNIFKEMSWRGLRKSEPAEMPRETSALHRMAYQRLLASGTTVDDYSSALTLSFEDLSELTPSAREFVGSSATRVGSLIFDIPDKIL